MKGRVVARAQMLGETNGQTEGGLDRGSGIVVSSDLTRLGPEARLPLQS